MDAKDRERLIEIHSDLKALCKKYDEDIPPLKALVQKHEVKITVITVLALALWGLTVAYFDGSWARFLK